MPPATKTIGAVRIVPSSRRETRPKAKTTLARTMKSTIVGSRKQSDAAGHKRNCLTHMGPEDRFGERVDQSSALTPLVCCRSKAHSLLYFSQISLGNSAHFEAISCIFHLAASSCCTSPYFLRRCFAALFEGKVHFLVALLHMASQRASEQRDEQAPKHFPLDEENAVSF